MVRGPWRPAEWSHDVEHRKARSCHLSGSRRSAARRDPTAETLRAVHRAHVLAIPFENLDAVLGRGISLDLGSLQDKMVTGGRGGYCHEHNLLFAAVLERLGFPLSSHLARIRLGRRLVPP